MGLPISLEVPPSMSPVPSRSPVLVGVGQVRQRAEDPLEAREPLELMAEAAERAAEDAGAPALLSQLDSIRVPQGLWKYANPPAWLAERFGCTGAETALGIVSGTTVLKMLCDAAVEIQEGKRDAVMIAGAESEHSKRRAKAAGLEPRRTVQEGPPPDVPLPDFGDHRDSPDIRAGLYNPTQCFGLFEVAMRHARGESIEAHRRRIAELWAGFAKVAAKNPYAWIQNAPDAEQIASPTGGNRVVSSPYLKYMVSNMVVDQGSAVILCSAERARALGIHESQWIHPWVGVLADVGKSLSERESFHEERTLRLVGERVFERSGVTPEELGPIDLYSCFPAAVQLGRKELGIPEDRTLTQTGGLTFFGGPFASYVIHALAQTVINLREDGSRPALCSGVGGFMSRHAVATFGREPREGGFERHELSDAAARLPGRAYEADHQGPVTIESYVVPHDRQGPERAVLATRTPEGARSWAQTRAPELLDAMIREEFCGRDARIGADRELLV